MVAVTALAACSSGADTPVASAPTEPALDASIPEPMAAGPDLVLHSGRVVTVDDDFSVVEAIAIDDGAIVDLGRSDDVLELAGADTRVVDLEGRSLLPGFIVENPVNPYCRIDAYRPQLRLC